MTIYGTFERDPRSPSAEPEGSQFRQTVLVPQSSISIYGTIDGGIRHLTNATAAGSRTKIGSNGEYYNNRLGFKGTEDLGGGMNAHFHLETGFNTGTGALDNTDGRFFNRISSVGFAGPFGSIDFGRQPSVACKAVYAYEPFQYRYVQIIPLAGAVAGNIDSKVSRPFGTVDGPRFSNGAQYLGKFGGFTVSAEYVMGEVAGSSTDASAKAVGLGYTDGTFTIGGAYTRQKPNVAATGTPDYRDQDQITFGGAYKIDAIRIAGGYINTTTETAVTNQAKNIWLGARYDVTSIVSVTTGYYRTTLETSDRGEIARRNFFIVGATYALSSRTSLYADIDQAILHGIVALKAGEQTRQTGTSIGINHMF
ncbi:porin [Herminiimonas contaminans]|uniref:Porin n=1 Tax=Herminiimonas contaminans TaxID=1111140 RepID=A0ABS0ERG1_9BURK|nr:porin [Herminiimonas contaminans]MBF8177412.1 porin [Herminiimonas contaminans]